MAGTLKLDILTPSGPVVAGESAAEVVVPTIDGELGILPQHTPLTTITKLGVVSVRRQPQDATADMDHYVIADGLAEILPDSVRLLVDEAQHVDSIDEAQVNRQLAAAKEHEQAAQGDREMAAAKAGVARATAWLDATRLRK